MKSSYFRWVLATAAILTASAAWGDKTYYTTGLQPMTGVVVHFLNASSGQAVPVSTTNPLPSNG